MRTFLFSLCFIINNSLCFGQDLVVEDQKESSIPLEISGSVDIYFRSNLGADFDFAPEISFANLRGFSLGMANLVLTHEAKKAGVVVDLVFGPRGEDATFLSEELRPGGISKVINQLYGYWNITSNLKATIGNFNTFLGYEVISPVGNFNYSTSYMFSYGPFSHTGLKIDIDLGENFSLMTGIFNPTDNTEYNPSNDFATGIQLGYENDGLNIWLNSLISDKFYQIDLTGGYQVTNSVYVGVNATTAQNAFWGMASYSQLSTSENLKLGTRIEYFKDKGILIESLGMDNAVIDITLSAEYKVGNLKLIPEYRMDIYAKDDVIPNGTELSDKLSSFIMAAVYEL